MQKISLYITILMLLTGCGRDRGLDSRLQIKNNSQDTLLYQFSFDYPDTALSANYNIANDTLASPTPMIQPTSTRVPYIRGRWEKIFPGEISSGKLEIFLFNVHTLKTTPWDSIVKHYMVLKRYDLTLDSLKKMNWIVTYP